MKIELLATRGVVKTLKFEVSLNTVLDLEYSIMWGGCQRWTWLIHLNLAPENIEVSVKSLPISLVQVRSLCATLLQPGYNILGSRFTSCSESCDGYVQLVCWRRVKTVWKTAEMQLRGQTHSVFWFCRMDLCKSARRTSGLQGCLWSAWAGWCERRTCCVLYFISVVKDTLMQPNMK